MARSSHLLRYWGCAFRLIELEAETGRWRSRFFLSARNAAKQSCDGFAYRRGRLLFSVYEESGEQFLQVGRKRYSFGRTDLEIECVQGSTVTQNRFTLRQASTTIMEFEYRSARSKLLNRLDPTFDAMDEEAEDFFLWLAHMSQDPQRRTAPFPQR